MLRRVAPPLSFRRRLPFAVPAEEGANANANFVLWPDARLKGGDNPETLNPAPEKLAEFT
jgi:hypothetical protein